MPSEGCAHMRTKLATKFGAKAASCIAVLATELTVTLATELTVTLAADFAVNVAVNVAVQKRALRLAHAARIVRKHIRLRAS